MSTIPRSSNRPHPALRGPRIAGVPAPVYLVSAAVVLVAALTDHLPTSSLLAGFAMTL
jgi:Na+/citrate or Na+/malate symporter